MACEDLRVVLVRAGIAGHLDFSPNDGIHFERWANREAARGLLEVCLNDTDTLDYYKHDWTFLFAEPFLLKKEAYYRMFAGYRGEMHEVICNYAEEIGVEMRFGEKVRQYVDTDQQLEVVLAFGETILGDVVVGAEGPKSLGREQVLGLPESKVKSGYAIYRAHYNLTGEHRKNPLLAPFCCKSPEVARLWLGTDLHMFVFSCKEGKDIGWVFTHKNEQEIGESGSYPGNLVDALAYLDEAHFEETCKEIFVDYKLVRRDPVVIWPSPSKRSCVIGDAAHCHLPTSAQGACQAVEDGVVLAVCLGKAKGDVRLALQVFERTWFSRSHFIHMSSTSVRDDYHTIEFESNLFEEHPEMLNMPRRGWAIDFDARKNAEKHFDQLAVDVKGWCKGTLEGLSLPAGGNFDLNSRDFMHSKSGALEANGRLKLVNA
ncbi:hypothetical protein SLS58_009539 [Diplodia intermedia]|uniref:FAD-binding domain-containing protein n=1 Tax=Diplodia intermedia TaxID=856260 RepID=A0ABR3TBS8_9PEZI